MHPLAARDDGDVGRSTSLPTFRRQRRLGGDRGALLLLVLLIVFILQNSTQVKVRPLGYAGSIPLPMAMLIAAVGGGVLVAIAGTTRIAQLRRTARRNKPPLP